MGAARTDPGETGPAGHEQPRLPRGDVESTTLDRDALAKATARDTRTAGQRNHDWKDGGPTDITNEDLACDACHALVHDGPGGWQTRVAPTESEYPGRTEWILSPHIDPERTPRVNHRHHLGDLLAAALAHYRARRDTELREHRRRWLREPAGDADDDGP